MNKIKRAALCIIVISVVFGIKLSNKETDVSAKQTLFVMGDSKSSFYPRKKYPRQGWVQQFIPMLKSKGKVKPYHLEECKDYENVVRYDFHKYSIENWSKGGISCKTFYETGRFAGMLKRIRKNDYVIIALQHNDKKPDVGEKVADYKHYLIYFIQHIQRKGGKVIFMTTPPKNYADRKTFKIYVPEYRNTMLQVAKDFKCNYIDLSRLSTDYFNFRGKNYVNTLYMKLNPGQYPAWEQGINDDTHFQRDGASVLARIIVVDLQANRQIPMLNKQFRQNTNALYATFQEAATYKNKKQYIDKSWNNMVKQRNNAWTILYTPGATNKQCHKAEQSLRRSLKGLRRKHG